MGERDEETERRAQRVRAEEGASHGRDPERMDPEMLEGEDAETVRANKEMKRRQRGKKDDDPQPLDPEERFPPD